MSATLLVWILLDVKGTCITCRSNKMDAEIDTLFPDLSIEIKKFDS